MVKSQRETLTESTLKKKKKRIFNRRTDESREQYYCVCSLTQRQLSTSASFHPPHPIQHHFRNDVMQHARTHPSWPFLDQTLNIQVDWSWGPRSRLNSKVQIAKGLWHIFTSVWRHFSSIYHFDSCHLAIHESLRDNTRNKKFVSGMKMVKANDENYYYEGRDTGVSHTRSERQTRSFVRRRFAVYGIFNSSTGH